MVASVSVWFMYQCFKWHVSKILFIKKIYNTDLFTQNIFFLAYTRTLMARRQTQVDKKKQKTTLGLLIRGYEWHWRFPKAEQGSVR